MSFRFFGDFRMNGGVYESVPRNLSIDGTDERIVTDRRWRTSIRQGRWRPAFPTAIPDTAAPGPRDPAPERSCLLFETPVGTASVDLPDGWQEVAWLDGHGRPAFPLETPCRLLVTAPTGSLERPALSFTPVPVVPAPLPELGFGDFSGRVRYETRFTVEAERVRTATGTVRLDLGEVGFTADVVLDDRPVGRIATPPYRVVLPSKLTAGEHTLRVEVTTLSASRRRYTWPPSTVPPETRRFLIERNPEAFLSGLIGPIELVFLKPQPAEVPPSTTR